MSAAGVDLARRVGTGLGPFSYVLASDVPRTSETALAMGFAVDDIVDMAGRLWDSAVEEKHSHHAQCDWAEEAFVRYGELVAARGPTAKLGRRQVELWLQVVNCIAPGGAGLVVTHGGLIEPGLVYLAMGADLSRWGTAIRHCEGARLQFDAQRSVRVDVVRLAPE